MQLGPRQVQSVWASEIDDIVRGASGGFLFGIPLLYTMEVWWIGSAAEPLRMLLVLGVTLVVVVLLNHVGGFRRTPDARLADATKDGVEALAIAVLCTALVLWLLRRITRDTPLDEGLGQIVYEAVPFALGVALARQFMSSGRTEDPADEGRSSADHGRASGKLSATLADTGATLMGALFVAFNIAPTDEIPMLALAVTGPWLIALVAASLVISYAIVFEAGLADERSRKQQQGIFQHPLSETVVAYLLSLLAAALMLVFFGQLDGDTPWPVWLSHTLILGLPAAIGGAAGRLAV